MWALWLVTGGAAVLFVATLAALRTDFRAASRAWKLLAASGILLAILGLGFAVRFWQPTSGPWAGQNAPSVRIYRDWASDPAGFVVLLASGIGLVSHWVVAILGFVTTGREVWRSEIADADPLDPGVLRS